MSTFFFLINQIKVFLEGWFIYISYRSIKETPYGRVAFNQLGAGGRKSLGVYILFRGNGGGISRR